MFDTKDIQTWEKTQKDLAHLVRWYMERYDTKLHIAIMLLVQDVNVVLPEPVVTE